MAAEETDNSCPEPRSHLERERRIAELADRQHGVVAVWQLAALGFTGRQIRYRARVGRLHRVHRGVYTVGYRTLTPKGHRMAAVLAYGPNAVLSHRSAAAHWDIGPPSWKIDVTTPGKPHSRKGIRAHRASLHPDEVTIRDGIRVTTVARTILDLAAQLRLDSLAHLIEQADRKDRLDLRAIDRAIARRPHAAGTVRLKAMLGAYRGAADTRSKLERDFRALITRAGLPEPQFNVVVAGLAVDVYWPQWKLVVELDSRLYHANPRAFENDRMRDATVQKEDIRVLRVTDERMDNEPAGVLADVLALRRE